MASEPPRKPQPTAAPLSLSPPTTTAMTPAELGPAIAALAAKKKRLRESFDRLAASSPVPIPFRWEDLDAHLSSVQSAVAAHFVQLDPSSFDPEFAAGGPTTVAELVEHLADENREPGVEGGTIQDAQESNAVDGEEARNAYFVQEQHGGNGVVSGASDGRRVEEGADEAGNETEEGAIEPSPEQDDEEGAIKVSIEAMDDDEAVNASADQEDESSSEEEEGEAKWPPHPRAAADSGGREKALARNIAAACATMDAAALVDALCQSCRSSLPARCAFLPALLGAADPHALVVRAVGGFLARPGSMTYRSWGNCVALLECLPRLTGTVAGPSADTMEQAERLAWEWKEMLVGKSGGSCRDMSRLAGWGLFTFLASYNILLEFEADEIIRLFDNLLPQLKENCIDLCKQLGLIEKMTDLIHHLIGNGQPFDAMRLASALNLTDKCPPLSLMDDYVKRAKKAAEELLSKENDSAESLVCSFSWKRMSC
ncbi:hypothetical protein QOZ80_3AG0227070 [Eleusine coracana subsp. coracana]|nr:hypothetical protein QOZ80_3AG0227070 [Eleusine coracana subsp. coracana]